MVFTVLTHPFLLSNLGETYAPETQADVRLLNLIQSSLRHRGESREERRAGDGRTDGSWELGVVAVGWVVWSMAFSLLPVVGLARCTRRLTPPPPQPPPPK